MSSGKSGGGVQSHDYYGSIAGQTNCERLDFIWGLLRDDKIIWPETKVWAAGSWPGGSIVVYNGRLYETPSTTSNVPPSLPWTLFRRDRGSTSNPYKITVPNLGEVFIYWGTDDQTLDTVDEQFLDANGHPPYRYSTVLALKKCLFGTEIQTAPNVVLLGGRAPQQTLITGDAAELDDDWQANPWAVIAEILTHPVIGFGHPDAKFHAASWQAEADWCFDRRGFTCMSPFYDSQTKLRSIVDDILSYVGGFIYPGGDGLWHAGHWPIGEAAPAFNAGTTLDMHDIINGEEIAWKGSGPLQTSDGVIVNYRDWAAAFNPRPAQASNLLNRQLTRRVNARTIERPFVVRANQAAAMAAELAKQNGDSFFAGDLRVRAEKATSITPGNLFLLTDDLIGMSRVARCKGKTIAKPPAGYVNISFESERGVSEQPYQATQPNPDPQDKPAPARITDFQLVQIPDSLSPDENNFRAICLAARDNAVTAALGIWWKQADAADFEQLATLNSFAVAGLMSGSINTADVTNESVTNSVVLDTTYDLDNGDIWNLTLQSQTGAGAWTDRTEGTDYIVDLATGSVHIYSGAGITAGDKIRVTYSLYVHFNLAGATPAGDIEAISAPLTADEINDNTLLLFSFQDADEHKFEIMSVKTIEALGGGDYRATIKRNSYGTLSGGDGVHTWTTDDRVFFVFRAGLFPIKHQSFEQLATSGDTATFRLVPASAWLQADLDDVYDGGTNPGGLTTEFDYEFTDPYAPTVSWKVLQANLADIADFSATFQTTDEFEFTYQFDDANGDLASARLVARLGTTELLLWSQILSGFTAVGSTTFKIAVEGDWEIIAVVSDQSGRVVEYPLTAVGGGSEVMLKIRAPASTTVATPTATITLVAGHTDWHQFVLACSTAGATIKYQVRDLYQAPGSYSTYSASFVVKRFHTVYAKAIKTGMTDSAVVKWDFP